MPQLRYINREVTFWLQEIAIFSSIGFIIIKGDISTFIGDWDKGAQESGINEEGY